MPRQRIQDEFSQLNVSRQRRYQIRHSALGLCVQCSSKKADDSIFCPKHKKQRNKRQKKLYNAAKKATKA